MRTIAEILEGIPKPSSHPHRAVIIVNGQAGSHGCVADRCSTPGGIFWPDSGDLLDNPIPDAILQISGTEKVAICNIHQCPASRIHWNFDLKEQ